MTLPEQPQRGVAQSVVAHSLLTAMMIALPMPVFVPAVLLHCGIRNGRRAAWSTLAIAFAAASLFAVISPTVSALDVVVTLAAIALPAMAVLPLVERGQNLGRVLVIMLIASAAGLLVIELGSRQLFSISPFAQEVEQLKQKSTQDLETLRANRLSPSKLDAVKKFQEITVWFLPGGALISMAVYFIFSLLMLGRLKAWRDLVAQRGDAGTAGAYLFRNFTLPEWVLFAFVAGGVAPLLSGMLQKIAGNLLALVVFLYIVQGLAILRFMLAAVGVGLLGTILGLMFIGLPTAPLLGVAGLFDPFFDFRHFKKRKDDSNESHSD